MAIIKQEDLLTNVPDVPAEQNTRFQPEHQPAPVKDTRSAGEKFAAGFKLLSPYTNLEGITRMPDNKRTNPDFNPFDHIEPTNYNAEDYQHFVYADSVEDVDRIKKKLSRDKENLEKASTAGAWGIAGMLSGAVLDPVNALPVTWGVKAIQGIGKAKSLARIGQGIGSGAALGTGVVGYQEAIITNNQLTRSAKDAWTAVIFGGIVGGILGGAVGGMAVRARAGAETIIRSVDANVKPKINPATGQVDFGPKSAGAAKVDDWKQLQEERWKEGIAYLDAKATQKIINNTDNQALKDSLIKKSQIQEQVFRQLSSPFEVMRSPSIRLLTSEFLTLKKVGGELFESPLIRGKETLGEATTPVEIAIRNEHGKIVRLDSELKKGYLQYIGLGGKAGTGVTANVVSRFMAARSRGELLNVEQFQAAIVDTINTAKPHKIPEVNKLASLFNEHYKGLATELTQVGRRKENPELFGRYTSWIYDVPTILRNPKAFKDMLYKNFSKRVINPEWEELKLAGKPTKGVRKFIQKPAQDIDDAVEKTYRRIINREQDNWVLARMAENLVTRSTKFTKERVLNLPYEDASPWIKKDLAAMTGVYSHRARTIIEVEKMLARKGWDSVDGAVDELTEELDIHIRHAKDELFKKFLKKKGIKDKSKYSQKLVDEFAETHKKQLDKIELKFDKKFQEARKLIYDSFDIITGNINKGRTKTGGRALQYVRKYITMNVLGGVTVSSLGDPVMAIFKHGLPRTIIDGWLPALRSIKTYNRASEELKDFQVGIELEMNSILKALHEGGEAGFDASKVARFTDEMVHVFGKLSLLSYWNTANKRIAAHISSARTLRAVEKIAKGARVSQKEIERLANLGIDKKMAKRIWEQFGVKKYGEKKDGSYISNFHLWDDEEAAKALGRSISKETNETILTPGLGDIPIPWQKSEVLKTVFLFKSFSATATNRLLLSGLQKRDLNTASGFIGLMAMGMMIHQLKAYIAGKVLDDDLDSLLIGALERNGVLGLMGDYILGLNPYSQNASKYAAFNGDNILLGPFYGGYLGKVYEAAIVGPSDGELDEKEQEKIRRLLLLQNIFYFQVLFGDDKKKRRRFN